MRLEEAVFAYLMADTALQNKIGERLYPLLLPQKCQLPAVVYSLVSIERRPALQRDTGFAKQILQFSCHAKNYSDAVATAQLLRGALQDYNGNMGSLFIGAVLVVSESATYEHKTQTYSSHVEFEFHFNED
ncbi:MAG: hypothetical protein SCM57_08270 [Bacillota bacterium]|nr:hypothetical protein [Bacillota bacterium]